MSLLPSIDQLRKEIARGKTKEEYTRDCIERYICPLCGGKLKQNARWLFCYRPTKHDMFRASKEKYGKAVNHSVPWESETVNRPTTKRKPSGNQKITKRRNSFKANVSKKSRKEWGERMEMLRSISKEQ